MKIFYKTKFFYKLVKSLAKKIGFSLVKTNLIKFNGWGLISQRDMPWDSKYENKYLKKIRVLKNAKLSLKYKILQSKGY